YVPSGTMANQLALRLVGRPGTDVLCAARSHVFRYENAAAAGNARVQLRPLPDPDGLPAAEDVAWAAESQRHHVASVPGIALENTHMAASGRPCSADDLQPVLAVARANGFAIHCDGARIWNAAVALGVGPAELVAGADTAMFCLSKGLGAP